MYSIHSVIIQSICEHFRCYAILVIFFSCKHFIQCCWPLLLLLLLCTFSSVHSFLDWFQIDRMSLFFFLSVSCPTSPILLDRNFMARKKRHWTEQPTIKMHMQTYFFSQLNLSVVGVVGVAAAVFLITSSLSLLIRLRSFNHAIWDVEIMNTV